MKAMIGEKFTGHTPEDQEMLDLIDLCKDIEVFEMEGTMFLGNQVHAVKRFLKERPSKKFYIWLQDNYITVH